MRSKGVEGSQEYDTQIKKIKKPDNAQLTGEIRKGKLQQW